MGICHDMKEGQIYWCKTCGLELKVVKGCESCCSGTEEGACSDENCTFTCCGEALQLKE